ncbi:hypothetical protein CSKR_105557 [Clonorchis sinensis]|uniref:Uncharacterized protein n=1 Tax=Clonorchis sinensis TaxID=79923 RepID=A0A419QEN7_CLOSI|nr:hypothetical protein CSKR_105557 [Clonorchis sinensis]
MFIVRINTIKLWDVILKISSLKQRFENNLQCASKDQPRKPIACIIFEKHSLGNYFTDSRIDFRGQGVRTNLPGRLLARRPAAVVHPKGTSEKRVWHCYSSSYNKRGVTSRRIRLFHIATTRNEKNCRQTQVCELSLKILSPCLGQVLVGSTVSSEVTTLQGKEMKHRETRSTVRGFKAWSNLRSSSSDTLNEG